MIERDERGMSTTVEFTVLLTVFLMLITLMVGAVRIWQARSGLDAMAESAARQASLARSPAAAMADATALVRADAQVSGFTCHNGIEIDVDTTGFTTPVGTAAEVTITLRCTVVLSDLVVPIFPGSLTLESRASSTLDRHRGRS